MCSRTQAHDLILEKLISQKRCNIYHFHGQMVVGFQNVIFKSAWWVSYHDVSTIKYFLYHDIIIIMGLLSSCNPSVCAGQIFVANIISGQTRI